MGNVYARKGNYEKALELCLKALIVFEAELGEDNQETKKVKRSVAAIYNRMGTGAFTKNPQIALDNLLQAHRLCPDDKVILKNMRLAYLATDRRGSFDNWLFQQID
jgi:tetratricopeptide (TPR) repeat protein